VKIFYIEVNLIIYIIVQDQDGQNINILTVFKS